MLTPVTIDRDLRVWTGLLRELYAQRDREGREYLTYTEWNADGLYYLADHETTSTRSFRAAALQAGLVSAEDLEQLEEIVLKQRGRLGAPASLGGQLRYAALDTMYRAQQAEKGGLHPSHFALRERDEYDNDRAAMLAAQAKIAAERKAALEAALEAARGTRQTTRRLRPAGSRVDIAQL